MRPKGADKGVLIRRFALWRKAFGGAGFACMDLQSRCLAKNFPSSPHVRMRVRARENMCKKRGAVGAVLVQVGAIYFFYLFIYLYLYSLSIFYLLSFFFL